MRIFLTGGAGYIGSVMVRELLAAGYDVTVFDTMFFGPESLEDVKDQIKLIKGDIRKITPQDIRGADVVIDLAAMSNDPAGELDPKLTESINHLGRVNVARISQKVGVEKYIAPSSAGNYGQNDKPVDETSEVRPITAYTIANDRWEREILPMAAKTKAPTAKIADREWENEVLPMTSKDFCVTVLRQSTVYGVSWRMRFDIIVNDFTLQVFRDKKIKIKGNGMEFRPFVHVKDTCQAFIKVIEAEKELVNGEIFNVGATNQSVRIKDVMSSVFDALKIAPKYEFGELIDKRDYRMVCDKIARVLKFKPRYRIEDGAREVYKALEDGFLKVDDPKTITLKWYKMLIEKGLFPLE